VTDREAHLSACLRRALDYAGNTHRWPEDVLPMLRDGRARFWERGDAVIITEMHEYPRARAVNYWLVAGTLPDTLALHADIEAHARAIGATRLEAGGRPGWTRSLIKLGWAPSGVIYRKELRDE
jgi:hypothetical protein